MGGTTSKATKVVGTDDVAVGHDGDGGDSDRDFSTTTATATVNDKNDDDDDHRIIISKNNDDDDNKRQLPHSSPDLSPAVWKRRRLDMLLTAQATTKSELDLKQKEWDDRQQEINELTHHPSLLPSRQEAKEESPRKINTNNPKASIGNSNTSRPVKQRPSATPAAVPRSSRLLPVAAAPPADVAFILPAPLPPPPPPPLAVAAAATCASTSTSFSSHLTKTIIKVTVPKKEKIRTEIGFHRRELVICRINHNTDWSSPLQIGDKLIEAGDMKFLEATKSSNLMLFKFIEEEKDNKELDKELVFERCGSGRCPTCGAESTTSPIKKTKSKKTRGKEIVEM